MSKLFDSLKDLVVSIAGVGEVAVDNLVFKLHRIGTVLILLSFVLVLSLSQVRKRLRHIGT